MQEMCCRSLDLKFKAKLKLVRKPKKSNMATRRPFWKWHIWKSMGFFPYRLVMCYWSLDLIFKAKQKLESGNRKIQDGHQAAILEVISLKINKLLPMVTKNMQMKFQIEIPKQTWVTLRKPCRLQTDGQTDRPTDKVIPVYPTPTPTNFVGRGYNQELRAQNIEYLQLAGTMSATLTGFLSGFMCFQSPDKVCPV